MSEYNQSWLEDTMPKLYWQGKQYDEELKQYYFHQRYYDPHKGVFTSRDQLFEKYFWMSPYAMVLNNFLKYIDPDGRIVKVTGDKKSCATAVKQMNGQSNNLRFSRDAKTGEISAKGEAKTDKDRYMLGIIQEQNINVEISTQNCQVGKYGGAFGGNTLTSSTTADATQYVNVNQLADTEEKVGCSKGNLIWHEISEGYEGGKISIKTNTPASPKFENIPNSIFDDAHYNAGEYFLGSIKETKIKTPIGESVTIPNFSNPLRPWDPKKTTTLQKYDTSIEYELKRQ